MVTSQQQATEEFAMWLRQAKEEGHRNLPHWFSEDGLVAQEWAEDGLNLVICCGCGKYCEEGVGLTTADDAAQFGAEEAALCDEVCWPKFNRGEDL